MITIAELNDRMPGFQLAVFETLWPAMPQLTHVYIYLRQGSLEIFIESEAPLSGNDKADCERLTREITDIAFPEVPASVKFDGKLPARALEVMSPSIFQTIAKAVAPWRLEAGR